MADLRRRWPAAARAIGPGRLRTARPKRTSGVATDVKQAAVRGRALGAGPVGFNICAIDQTRSGLAFTTRKR